MRLIALVGTAAAVCALALATAASGQVAGSTGPLATEATQLEPVASAIAGQPLKVLCYREGEPGDPLQWGGWAYVDLFRTTVNLSKAACDGALAVNSHDMSVPLIEQALGALSLTHEAYHLNLSLPFARRASEAQTECRAVKRVAQTFTDLGASKDLADILLPWALAAHYKETSMSKSYDWRGCRVPVFAEFWG